ncbi:MAG TPA: DUF58 domain-containing protein, partial [Symbiobacteriaceae bacterium]|nr:DUF58 domain-containing protein [Symbiobacteriaceae bacterium]
GLLLVAFFWVRHAMRRTECLIQVESDRMEVGQSMGVKVRLDCDTFLPLPWVEVDDATPQHLVVTDMPRQATSVPLWGSRLVTFRLTARRRGHYTVGPIRVTLGDAFGLFQSHREFHSRATVTVYPRVHHIEGLPVPLSQPFGPVRTREKAFEDPSNQAEIRKYRPGDNPRHIHWKTSARMGELMLREYELNATTQMILFPDLSYAANNHTTTGPSTEETTVEIAASLAALGLRRKIEVSLICHSQERYAVPAGRGQRTFHELLEVLARVEAQGKVPIEQVLEREAGHLSGRTTLVVITAQLTPRLADVLIRLRSNHQVMLVLLRKESFEPTGEKADEAAAAAEPGTDTSSLTGLLTLRHIAVYMVSPNDDLRRLADLRLVSGTEGVRAWSQSARP